MQALWARMFLRRMKKNPSVKKTALAAFKVASTLGR